MWPYAFERTAPPLYLCLTKKQAVDWIQRFLEPVYRRRGVRDTAHPTPGKRVSWNPAEIRRTWEGIEKNSFWMWWRKISGQQSEKIALLFIKYLLKVTCSYLVHDHCFSLRRINHLVPYHLHRSSVNLLLTSCAELFMLSPPSGEAKWRRTRKRNKTRLNCCGQHATSLREVDSWQTRKVKRRGCELEQQNEGRKWQMN